MHWKRDHVRPKWPDRLGHSTSARAVLAIALSGFAAFTIVLSSRLGAAASFAIACTSAALAFLVLLSLLDEDIRVRRIIATIRNLAERLPSGAEEDIGPEQSLSAIERSVCGIIDLVASIEQRLLHRHPVSGLPTREPLLSAMETDGIGSLGIIHIADLERLQAFDEARGDQMLEMLARRVVQMLGSSLLVAQIDRSRLAVWFGTETATEVADTKLQALGYALGEAIHIADQVILPKVHVSSVRMEQGSPPPAQLIALAALSGDGPMSIPASAAPDESDPLTAAAERYALEQDLRHAMARGELALAYQPLVDVQTGAVCGAEALLRWHHPTRGAVSPTRFVPIMEEAGLAGEIGLWALNTACREAQSWRRTGLGTLRVAVNISARQLDGNDLGAMIGRTLARHALTSDMLEIELTETIATGGNDRVAVLFAELRRLGVAVAIDDFGTGYSSFSTLRTLRFDKIKIDREFVTAVDTRRDSQAICRSILALGQGLGIRVLAEGAETEGEYGWLRAQGCRYFQGYYFSRPLEAPAFHTFVRDRERLAALIDPDAFPSPKRLRA